MASITLHYNPECAACARQAQLTASLDWLGRVALSIADSPIGAVPRGRMVVVDTRDRARVHGDIRHAQDLPPGAAVLSLRTAALHAALSAGWRAGTTRAAMATPARSDGLVLLALALLHLAAQVAHGYGHVAAGVPLTAFQQLFVVVIVTVAPLAAVYAYWKLDRRRGAGLFAVSMGAAFLFGYLLHFVIDSPDLHANVTGEHSAVSSIPPWPWRCWSSSASSSAPTWSCAASVKRRYDIF